MSDESKSEQWQQFDQRERMTLEFAKQIVNEYFAMHDAETFDELPEEEQRALIQGRTLSENTEEA